MNFYHRLQKLLGKQSHGVTERIYTFPNLIFLILSSLALDLVNVNFSSSNVS